MYRFCSPKCLTFSLPNIVLSCEPPVQIKSIFPGLFCTLYIVRVLNGMALNISVYMYAFVSSTEQPIAFACSLLFKGLGSVIFEMFLKEDYYDHQDCILRLKNTVNTVLLLTFKINVFYLKICSNVIYSCDEFSASVLSHDPSEIIII